MKNKNLVIVESPTKAKTISKILGSGFSVVSTMGHVIDLPKGKLGINIEDGFKPDYVVLTKKKKTLSAIKRECKDKETIYVATDPDREGEAIGWHIKERILKDKNVFRVVFHEITPSAVKEAFKNQRDFDLHMVEAQAGRRILDRIVGYFLSPLLWKKIGRGLSAGRVQSVALKLIVDRERAISNFVPQEYWEVEAELKKVSIPDFSPKELTSVDPTAQGVFIAKLEKIADKKAQVKNKEEAEGIVNDLKGARFIVSDVKTKERKRYSYPPFITSTMQQEAFNKLRFNASKTMIVAQQLYEGIDIGAESPAGLITYMRTDSPRAAPEAIKEVRDFILTQFGKKYLPDQPNVYKVKKLAQEAHEAIRPTSLARSPESIKGSLSAEQYELYELIYKRFVSSQMNPAEFSVTTVLIQADKYLFSASGSTLIFDGFTVMYNKEDEEENEEKKKRQIPSLSKDEVLDLVRLVPSQHFTKPPARFSDSSLIKALEEEGIGRPSTYAPTISTIVLRDYARRIKGYFHATELGFKVCDLLVEYFPKIMDLKFTARMEEDLDRIEEGEIDKVEVLNIFYSPFKESVDFAQAHIVKEVITTGEACELCGKPMIVKWGKKGKFLSCSGFPECKNAKSITTKVKCPGSGCTGELIERHSSRGIFYGCSRYPDCRFTSRSLPEEKTE